MELAEYRRMAEVEDTHWWYRSTRTLLQELLADRLRQGGRFLDLGAGTGATGAWLAEHGRLVAADFEPLALTLHRERHPASDVVACDASTLPFADASFDAVLCVTVLCHRSIESPVAAVGRDGARRCVRAGWCACGSPASGASAGPTTGSPTPAGGSPAGDLAGLLVGQRPGRRPLDRAPTRSSSRRQRRRCCSSEGSTSSDLDRNGGGLGGVLPAVAGPSGGCSDSICPPGSRSSASGGAAFSREYGEALVRSVASVGWSCRAVPEG